jgi:hypothetical protein
MLSCKILSTSAAVVLYNFVMLITNAKPCQNSELNLCGMESSQMLLPGIWISSTYLFKNKFKPSNTYIIRYHNKGRERVFLFPCLKLLLGHSNRWTQCYHHEPSCGVRSSKERRLTTFVSLLPLSPLWVPCHSRTDLIWPDCPFKILT